MTALASDRNTIQLGGDTRVEPLAAAVKVWAGSLLMRNGSGHITKGAAATGCIGVGRSEALVDNGAGVAAARSVEYRRGIFGFANSGATDQIGQADIGKLCYIVDDQTVARTDGTGTRSPAGIVDGIEGDRVWVRLDEAITRGVIG
ncbi:hypothetical protein [Gemmobacter sp.]|uniref:hypothetical protein n=1 Tax=Gemmobacter sp. TaxID=1898957 RepID=UPI002AFFBE1E|nr:hypothetical protein [Gemmobacter sp.]